MAIDTLQQPDIAGAFAGGLQNGQALQANQLKLDQQQLATANAAQYKTDLQSYLQNPSAQNAAAMMAKHPEFQKSIQASFNTFSQGAKDDVFKAGTQAYLAIQNGKPEVAKQILDQRIEAAQNAGQDTADLENLKGTLDKDPQAAASGLALTMSALNPDSWSKVASEQRASAMAPSELSASQAKAQKAAVDAKFAESSAVQDLAKGGWEISKMQNDIQISRQNSQIAAMNAAAARENNTLKREELQQKIQDKVIARDQAVQTKAADVTSARSSIDNFLNTADRVLQTPADVIESATGTVSSRLPTLDADTADFEELVNTLSSQAFMAQIPAMKGLGALSEAEGTKLQSSLQSLSLRQSKERLVENVREAQRLLLKARENLTTKYGVPDVTPDTPASQPTPQTVNSLIQKYSGGQ